MWFFGSSDIKKMKAAKDIDGLIKTLQDKKASKRHLAAEALGEIGDPKALEPLIDVLKDKKRILRRNAARALGNIGDTRAIDPLIKTLEDENLNVRRDAALALGEIGGPRAGEALVKVVESRDGNTAALVALGKTGDPRAVEPLVKVVLEGRKENSEQSILDEVNNAIVALGEIGDPRAVDTLILALRDGVWGADEVSANAAKALGKIGDARAVKPLLRALEETGKLLHYAKTHFSIPKETLGNHMKTVYGTALSEINDPQAVDMLEEALKDSNPNRLINPYPYAAQALGKIGSPDAVRALVAALNDINLKNWWLSGEATVSLVKTGKNGVLPLINVLKHEKWWVKMVAAQALGEIGDSRAAEPLLEVLDDKDKKVRGAVADALDKLGKRPQ